MWLGTFLAIKSICGLGRLLTSHYPLPYYSRLSSGLINEAAPPICFKIKQKQRACKKRVAQGGLGGGRGRSSCQDDETHEDVATLPTTSKQTNTHADVCEFAHPHMLTKAHTNTHIHTHTHTYIPHTAAAAAAEGTDSFLPLPFVFIYCFFFFDFACVRTCVCLCVCVCVLVLRVGSYSIHSFCFSGITLLNYNFHNLSLH